MLDLVRPVDPGAPWSGADAPPARQGLDPAEDRARPTAQVLGVLPAVATRGGGDGFTSVPEELVGLLVHAHHRRLRVTGAGVDAEDVLHPGDELCVGLGWDGPALLQMRTQRPVSRPSRWWSGPGPGGHRSARPASPAVAATNAHDLPAVPSRPTRSASLPRRRSPSAPQAR